MTYDEYNALPEGTELICKSRDGIDCSVKSMPQSRPLDGGTLVTVSSDVGIGRPVNALVSLGSLRKAPKSVTFVPVSEILEGLAVLGAKFRDSPTRTNGLPFAHALMSAGAFSISLATIRKEYCPFNDNEAIELLEEIDEAVKRAAALPEGVAIDAVA